MKDQQQQRLLATITTVIRLSRIAQQVCEQAGITLPQYRALNSLAHVRRRAHEVARHTAVSRPAVTALMAGLEKMGLVERETDEFDKRGVHFTSSPNAKKLFADVNRLLVQRFTEVLGDSAKALVMLAASTPAIEEALDRQAEREFGTADTPFLDESLAAGRRGPAGPRAGTGARTRSGKR